MPNWKIHIEVGKRLNKYFKYDKEDLELFLLGSILPDINNCHVLKDISQQIDYTITHLGSFKEATYMNFYKKYKNEIDNKNSLFNGYLAHLYTDYMWNKNFRKKIEKLDIPEEQHDNLRKMKQSDFKIYNNKFIENTIQIDDINAVLKEIRKIKEVSITKEDILNVIYFLNNQEIYEGQFKFHSMEELDKLMDNTITEYVSFLK